MPVGDCKFGGFGMKFGKKHEHLFERKVLDVDVGDGTWGRYLVEESCKCGKKIKFWEYGRV